MLEGILLTRTCEDWIEACHAASVPAGRVKTVSEALQSPSVIERGVIETLDHPELGPISLIPCGPWPCRATGPKGKGSAAFG